MANSMAVIENSVGSAHAPIFDQPEGTDWFLAWLIGLANDHGIEQGITLTIGVITAIFSAVTVTRLMIALWLRYQKRHRREIEVPV